MDARCHERCQIGHALLRPRETSGRGRAVSVMHFRVSARHSKRDSLSRPNARQHSTAVACVSALLATNFCLLLAAGRRYASLCICMRNSTWHTRANRHFLKCSSSEVLRSALYQFLLNFMSYLALWSRCSLKINFRCTFSRFSLFSAPHRPTHA